jgi:hypothetical protein
LRSTGASEGSERWQALGVGPQRKVRNEDTVARTSWFDEKAEHPSIQERVSQLQTFTDALADGMVTKQELAGQEQRLLAAMKNVEPNLNDELHGKVTDVLVELTAYNIMRLLHELQIERMRMATQASS